MNVRRPRSGAIERPISVAQVLTGAAAAVALLYFLGGILLPVVIALVLVVLVGSLVRSIHRRWPRVPGWAVSALAALTVIVVTSAAVFVLAQGATELAGQGPALIARLEQIVQDTGRSLGLKEPLHLATIVGGISVPQLAGHVLSAVQDLATGVLLVIVYFAFMVGGRRRIASKIGSIASSSERAGAIRNVIERITANIEIYLWVETLTGLMLAGSAGLVMWSVGLHNIPSWVVIFFLLTFIPTIGVTIGSIAPALFALLQFNSPWPAIVIFGGIQIVAFVVGNLVYPRMQAETQNIDPVVTLLALSFWSLVWGLPGAFLAVPLTLMLMIVFAEFESTRWIAALLSNDGRPKR
jgi:predicted PurR-regulated permease PerM